MGQWPDVIGARAKGRTNAEFAEEIGEDEPKSSVRSDCATKDEE
jgi:hypothetical protein